MTVGYSGTPLAKKLGIKNGFSVLTVNAPDDYAELVGSLPENVTICDAEARASASAKQAQQNQADLIHIFTNGRDELQILLSRYVRQIKQNGTIWVSWYKKAAKLPTEITEENIREACFPLGL
ncbi:MAG: DUF3052 domain-containing protein, partial [Acidobacteriota bacterium]